jgi:hypothetical protein
MGTAVGHPGSTRFDPARLNPDKPRSTHASGNGKYCVEPAQKAEQC